MADTWFYDPEPSDPGNDLDWFDWDEWIDEHTDDDGGFAITTLPTSRNRSVMTECCPTCHDQFNGKMPGHYYGSNWDWVPCQTCQGTGSIESTCDDD